MDKMKEASRMFLEGSMDACDYATAMHACMVWSSRAQADDDSDLTRLAHLICGVNDAE